MENIPNSNRDRYQRLLEGGGTNENPSGGQNRGNSSGGRQGSRAPPRRLPGAATDGKPWYYPNRDLLDELCDTWFGPSQGGTTHAGYTLGAGDTYGGFAMGGGICDMMGTDAGRSVVYICFYFGSVILLSLCGQIFTKIGGVFFDNGFVPDDINSPVSTTNQVIKEAVADQYELGILYNWGRALAGANLLYDLQERFLFNRLWSWAEYGNTENQFSNQLPGVSYSLMMRLIVPFVAASLLMFGDFDDRNGYYSGQLMIISGILFLVWKLIFARDPRSIREWLEDPIELIESARKQAQAAQQNSMLQATMSGGGTTMSGDNSSGGRVIVSGGGGRKLASSASDDSSSKKESSGALASFWNTVGMGGGQKLGSGGSSANNPRNESVSGGVGNTNISSGSGGAGNTLTNGGPLSSTFSAPSDPRTMMMWALYLSIFGGIILTGLQVQNYNINTGEIDDIPGLDPDGSPNANKIPGIYAVPFRLLFITFWCIELKQKIDYKSMWAEMIGMVPIFASSKDFLINLVISLMITGIIFIGIVPSINTCFFFLVKGWIADFIGLGCMLLVQIPATFFFSGFHVQSCSWSLVGILFMLFAL